MSVRTSLVVFLGVLILSAVAVAPANALQPAPKTYAFLDIDGFLIECIDFTNQGNAFFYFSDRKGVFETLDVSEITGTPGDSVYWGQAQNLDLAGLPSRKTNFHGTCESQGISFYNAGATSYQGCSMMSFNRYPFGNFNESWLAIQLPVKCDVFFGAARSEKAGDALMDKVRGPKQKN